MLTISKLYPVCVDVLSQKGNFNSAVINQRLNFGQNVSRSTIFFFST